MWIFPSIARQAQPELVVIGMPVEHVSAQRIRQEFAMTSHKLLLLSWRAQPATYAADIPFVSSAWSVSDSFVQRQEWSDEWA